MKFVPSGAPSKNKDGKSFILKHTYSRSIEKKTTIVSVFVLCYGYGTCNLSVGASGEALVMVAEGAAESHRGDSSDD